MSQQLSLLASIDETIVVEELFEPNGHRRCPTCRKRLRAFAGRLLCVSASCPGVSR